MDLPLTDQDKTAIKTLVTTAIKQKYPDFSDAVIDDLYNIQVNVVTEYMSTKQ